MMAVPVEMDTKITVSVANNRKSKNWKVVEGMTWQNFVEKLRSKSVCGQETHEEYLALTRDRQAALKDIGGFVGGGVNDGRRIRGSVKTRQLFTGDADHVDPDFWSNYELFGKASLLYSTRKHGPIAGDRLRLVVPFSRAVNEAEYNAVARWICNWFGMHCWDSTTLEINRLMYFPSHSADVTPIFEVVPGVVLNVDSVLASYKDWTDITQWPRFSGEDKPTLSGDAVLADPRQRDGLVGAFCRAYGVVRCLEEVIQGAYTSTGQDDRYTFVGGTTSGGAVVYDDLWMHSYHETDPCSGRSVNAFDLVRLHKFGHLDAGLDDFERLELSSLPSQSAMMDWVKELPEVQEEMLGAKVKPLRDAEQIIADVKTRDELMVSAAAKLRGLELDGASFELIAQQVRSKMKELTGGLIPIGVCRDLIKPVEAETDSSRPWCADYVFVTDIDKFVSVETGETLTKTGFNAKFNRLIPDDDPDASADVLNNGAVPTVRGAMYAPMYGPRFEFEGAEMVNTFVPTSVPLEATQIKPEGQQAIKMIVDHIRRLFSSREALVQNFLQFLAHNVQKPGKKIRHAWLIKGCEGDGKTTLHYLMGRVMGARNVRAISLQTVMSQFNGYAEGASFAVFEEVRIQGQSRYEVYNAIKPLITNSVVEIHRKGRDGYQAMNCTNYIALTNHVDAFPLTDHERRFNTIFSPFETQAELLAEVGLDFFTKMYRAIDECADQLRTWLLGIDISTFDPYASAVYTAEKGAMNVTTESEDLPKLREIVNGEKVLIVSDLKNKCELEGLQINNRQIGKMLMELGYTRWYTQLKIQNRNVIVYGKGSNPMSTSEVRDIFEPPPF